ncbi:hypothetical protein [Rhodopirellula sp. MGV]|uniref:hypothetical protein n=1 Tax=Rhodopirellula sp. MGV TaxID=2023130 RepID=UPI00117A9971|nr:hypothetical protein [Rhodopirellula sp. MGV]
MARPLVGDNHLLALCISAEQSSLAIADGITMSITWLPQTTDHFIEHNMAAHLHRLNPGVSTTTVCSSPPLTRLLDRHCEG